MVWLCAQGVALLLGSGGEVLASEADPAENSISVSPPGSSSQDCARTACYAFLRLMDKPVTRSEIDRAIRLGAGGASLLDIKQAAEQFGVACTAIRTSPAGFSSLVAPAVVHTQVDSSTGHFLVFFSHDQPGYGGFIDGTSGELLWIRQGDFFRGWSGYALVPEHPVVVPGSAKLRFRYVGWVAISVGVVGMFILLLNVGVRYFGRRGAIAGMLRNRKSLT